MTIVELRDAIEQGTLSDNFLVLRYAADTFLAEQYVSEICKLKGMQTKVINSLNEIYKDDFSSLFSLAQDINLLITDTFDEVAEYYDLTNTIVICNKIDKKIATKVEAYVVDMPEAGDWQTKAYIASQCPGLMPNDIDMLYTYSGGNTYRISTELEKLKMFNENEQSKIFREELKDPATDLIPKTQYDQLNFTEYLLLGDLVKMKQFEQHMNIYQFDAMAVITLALRKIKQYVLFKFGQEKDMDMLKAEFGYTDAKKAWALKRLTSMPIKLGRAMFLMDTLSAIDYRLKNGELDMSRERLLDYIIVKTARLGHIS